MPDPFRLTLAVSVAAAVAALVLWASRLRPTPRWLSAGWLLGCGCGFYLGVRLLGLWPHWPPREDQDRLLLFVIPATALVELLAAWAPLPRAAAWGLRLLVAAGAGRVLLAGSSHLSTGDQGGLDRFPWILLGVLALCLFADWCALVALGRRTADGWLPACLSIACGGASLALMLSGYLSGGQLGLPFAGALAGGALVAWALPKPLDVTSPIALGTVMLFCLVVIGHFFGELTPIHAGLLLAVSLLAWLPDLPPLRRWPAGVRGAARAVLVAAAVGGVVWSAQRAFVARSQNGSRHEVGADDYLHYGR